jgi:inositol-phosphate transport system permease protein
MTTVNFGEWNFVGLANYKFILQHPDLWLNSKATVVFTFATLILFNVGLALVLALLTTHVPRRAGFFFRALWLLPRITPVIVYVLLWQFISASSPFGILNEYVVVPLGGDGTRLLPAHAMEFIIVMSGIIGASFGMIIFTSAIESIPRDYLNAALVDGAGIWQRIRYVILPVLKWPLLFVTTYQTLSLFTSFEYILALTDGGYETRVWSLWAYQAAFSSYTGNFRYGFGSALAVLLVAVGIVFSFIYMRFFRFNELVQTPRIEAL